MVYQVPQRQSSEEEDSSRIRTHTSLTSPGGRRTSTGNRLMVVSSSALHLKHFELTAHLECLHLFFTHHANPKMSAAVMVPAMFVPYCDVKSDIY